MILKKDLAALISESDSPLKGDWEAGIGKIWSSPTIGPVGADLYRSHQYGGPYKERVSSFGR